MKFSPERYCTEINFKFVMELDNIKVTYAEPNLEPINVLDSLGNPVIAYKRQRWVKAIYYLTLNGITIDSESLQSRWGKHGTFEGKIGHLEDEEDVYTLEFSVVVYSAQSAIGITLDLQEFLKSIFDVEVEIS